MRYLDFERPLFEIEDKIKDLEQYSRQHDLNLDAEIGPLRQRLRTLEHEIYDNLTKYQRVQLARHPDRPYTLDYIQSLMTDFIELHGDRTYGDDKAIVAGFATFRGRQVVVVGHQKGRNTEENLARNFGMPHPEGFRKAQRVMKLGERFGLPVLSFVDSTGAYPGLGAEERGQHNMIACNLEVMAQLATPIVVVVTGEGGSGGALAIAVGDRVLMMEYSYYAVCTPEACAAILYKDRARASEAVESMRCMPEDLLRLGVIDEVVPEPLGGAHRNPRAAMDAVGQAIETHLNSLCELSPEELVELRYQKFRNMGIFMESGMIQNRR